ncbi:MAG: cupin domain-containing protein [Phycisphaerales bacterium]|nr:cupin domain-containing protein [Phycisphaerales bacterium]
MEHLDIDAIVQRLQLAPHPEGGFYRQTWVESDAPGVRSHGTAIYFLLPGNVENRWHRIDAAEMWHYYAGAPLDLHLSHDPPASEEVLHLGTDLDAGQRPQAVVAPHQWQRAESLGEWTLVGCTVSPAFQFEHFEMMGD